MTPAKAKPKVSLVDAAISAARVRGAGGRIIVALALNGTDGTVLDVDNAVDLENAWNRAGELVTLSGVKDAVQVAVSLDVGGVRVMLPNETVTLDL